MLWDESSIKFAILPNRYVIHSVGTLGPRKFALWGKGFVMPRP